MQLEQEKSERIKLKQESFAKEDAEKTSQLGQNKMLDFFKLNGYIQ